VGVIRKKTLAEALHLVAGLDASLYDCLELRLDACADFGAGDRAPALERLRSCRLPLPAIFTLRRPEEGGDYRGSEEDRLACLASLMRLKPAYMDIEASVPPERIAAIRALSPETVVLLSRHDFEKTPESLQAVLDSMRERAGGVIHKIAVRARSGLDALRMLAFCREQSRRKVPLIGISMGKDGESTRILAPVAHTGFCYCPVEEASAPGQLDVLTLRNRYQAHRLNQDTAVYGLLGDPVEQSAGHVYHNEQNMLAGINAVYVKWRIAGEELGEALPLLAAFGVRGLSLTMPLKEAALPLADCLEEAAAAIGAVNTLRAEEGGWRGTNTDGQGALESLPPDLAGKKLVMLGAGGAARAVAREAARRGAELLVYNRSRNKELPGGVTTRPLSSLEELKDMPYAVIINALPFDADFSFAGIPFQPGSLALDLSYGRKSVFLELAGAAGCRVLDGAGMFRGQARLQRKFWGLPVDGGGPVP
jgi:3-dehydroquinate dehydratase/shikimate dehydrogenase